MKNAKKEKKPLKGTNSNKYVLLLLLRSVLVFIILSFHMDVYTTCVACIGVPAYLSGYIAIYLAI